MGNKYAAQKTLAKYKDDLLPKLKDIAQQKAAFKKAPSTMSVGGPEE